MIRPGKVLQFDLVKDQPDPTFAHVEMVRETVLEKNARLVCLMSLILASSACQCGEDEAGRGAEGL